MMTLQENAAMRSWMLISRSHDADQWRAVGNFLDPIEASLVRAGRIALGESCILVEAYGGVPLFNYTGDCGVPS